MKSKINRIIMIVLDSFGVGELPDADKFGDVGAHTAGHIVEGVPNIKLPNLKKLGLFNLSTLKYLKDAKIVDDNDETIIGSYGKAMEVSAGKETLVGHFEIAGVPTLKPLPTYPNGFPKRIIDEFEKRTGRSVIANIPASGTAIIEEFGDEHVKTGSVIVYTSADSVFQIAAHEDIVPLDELYNMCHIAREILVGEDAVSRVIARPFNGTSGNYTRTANRHDYALNPPSKTILDKLKDKGFDVCAVGKIRDIFNGSGITDYVYTKSNAEGIDKTLEYIKCDNKGLIFTNLVDFDMMWGHRRDINGYAAGLEYFDVKLNDIFAEMKDEDMLIVTADHGCDPTFKGTDHTREYIPILMYGKNIKQGIDIGTRETFSDIAATIAEILEVEGFDNSKSFFENIK